MCAGLYCHVESCTDVKELNSANCSASEFLVSMKQNLPMNCMEEIPVVALPINKSHVCTTFRHLTLS
jgi:hypothetical protein